MKCRMINVIGRKIRILFEQPTGIVILPKLYSKETTIDDVRDQLDWEELEKKYGKRSGWGMQDWYDNETGEPQPGDMFWRELSDEFKTYEWDNGTGKELHVVLPNGMHWNIDGRARNCTMPKERTHRCWVRTGTPPNITVGKGGHTCSAGAGSIQAGDYHGFLRNGEFT